MAHPPAAPAPAARAEPFDAWLTALAERHMADLRPAEVTRALRALSSTYVSRRDHMARAALNSAGKRAAFALFYGPLHFLTVQHVSAALQATEPPPRVIIDLGCGTGVAGAALAMASPGRPPVTGFDRHPWAVDESRWTYRHLGVAGQAMTRDVRRLPSLRPGGLLVAAYLLNELAPGDRERLEEQLLAQQAARVLVIEPIARRITPWWDATAARVVAAGGRADEWRFRVDLPPPLRLLDRAAGLDHRELTARTLYFTGGRAI